MELSISELINALSGNTKGTDIASGFIGKYCMVRTYSAGVFAGTIISREGKEILLKDARRIWRWEGAASLSQLAQSGTSKPYECKFPESVASVLLTECIEIIPISSAAQASISEVPIWEE